MNTTMDCRCENVKSKEHSLLCGDLEKTLIQSSEGLDSYCTDCCNTSEYSVRSLRQFFLQNNSGLEDAKSKTSPAIIQRLPVCKCNEHMERMSEKCVSEKSMSEGPDLSETRTVTELKKIFEAKMKAVEQGSSTGSVSAYSRPVTARTDDRHDAVSVDLPHPEGQMCMYSEVPIRSKPCTRWHITNSSIVEIPSGMQITFTMSTDSNH